MPGDVDPRSLSAFQPGTHPATGRARHVRPPDAVRDARVRFLNENRDGAPIRRLRIVHRRVSIIINTSLIVSRLLSNTRYTYGH